MTPDYQDDPVAPLVDIIIPTHNRAHLIPIAVRAALDQSWWNCRVTVIDDAGSDRTEETLRPFFERPNFNYIRLAKNLGTANAKNAGLLLTGGAAVTFHDSDDIPHRDKLLHQVRVLCARDIHADPCLNWAPTGHRPGQRLDVGAALVHHELILPDGRRVEIRRDQSLFDDVFPNTQMGTQVPGEWTHINSGLFRHATLARNGGFENCIEEDREFRNRLILNGEIVWIVPELLLTKIETPDSLTQSKTTDYDSERRRADRLLVWERVAEWRRTGRVRPVEIDLPDLKLERVSNPALLCARNLPMTAGTRVAVEAILGQWQKGRSASEAAA
ncbi:glycosyltransferase family 2 protein [Paracoccus sp. TK19116]|uniref:Glycosyltransferase family 2 protein n=1 Tax=Paracoccus albicereus TaxID=2922394 RepID=A0ABT1MQ06_9RHOB|nr:glycosyltransferase family 2 protein [Paracoccus albicereus]MCQ0969591.1 glycosyltransferase family 2 protein [Paracoccus albicereus]